MQMQEAAVHVRQSSSSNLEQEYGHWDADTDAELSDDNTAMVRILGCCPAAIYQ